MQDHSTVAPEFPRFVSALLHESSECPGLSFIWPFHPESHGFPQNGWGHSIPLGVLRSNLVTSEELYAAVDRLGGSLGLKRPLRAAAKTWLESADATPPHAEAGESRDDAVRRVRAELDEARRQREQAEEQERNALYDEDLALHEARNEIIDRHIAAMQAELNEWKATRARELATL